MKGVWYCQRSIEVIPNSVWQKITNIVKILQFFKQGNQ